MCRVRCIGRVLQSDVRLDLHQITIQLLTLREATRLYTKFLRCVKGIVGLSRASDLPANIERKPSHAERTIHFIPAPQMPHFPHIMRARYEHRPVHTTSQPMSSSLWPWTVEWILAG